MTPKPCAQNHAISLFAIAENQPNYADVSQNQFVVPVLERRITANVPSSSNNQPARYASMSYQPVFAEKLLKSLHAKLVLDPRTPVPAEKSLFPHARSASNLSVFVLKKLKSLFLANHPNLGSAKNVHTKEPAALAHPSRPVNNALNVAIQFLSACAKKLILAMFVTENHATVASNATKLPADVFKKYQNAVSAISIHAPAEKFNPLL